MSLPRALKLTYFDMTGRGELIRLLFGYGGIPFEDERVTRDAFPGLKPALLLGQVPIIDVDGATFAQSMAIARFAAKLAGLYPQDPIAALRADMVSETLSELRNTLGRIIHTRRAFDEAAQEARFQEYKDVTVSKAFTTLESMVQGRFISGNDAADASYADVQLYDIAVNMLQARLAYDTAPLFPRLQSVVDTVSTVPNVVAYLTREQQRLKEKLEQQNKKQLE